MWSQLLNLLKVRSERKRVSGLVLFAQIWPLECSQVRTTSKSRLTFWKVICVSWENAPLIFNSLAVCLHSVTTLLIPSLVCPCLYFHIFTVIVLTPPSHYNFYFKWICKSNLTSWMCQSWAHLGESWKVELDTNTHLKKTTKNIFLQSLTKLLGAD